MKSKFARMDNVLEGLTPEALQETLDVFLKNAENEQALLIKDVLLAPYFKAGNKDLPPNECCVQLPSTVLRANVDHLKRNGFRVWTVETKSKFNVVWTYITWNDANLDEVLLERYSDGYDATEL